MADIKAYHRLLRAETERLEGEYPEGCLYVTSVATPGDSNTTGGRVTEVNLDTAARGFVAGTMRVSTTTEIQTHLTEGESFKARTNAQTQRERHPATHFVAEGK